MIVFFTVKLITLHFIFLDPNSLHEHLNSVIELLNCSELQTRWRVLTCLYQCLAAVEKSSSAKEG